MKLIVTRRGEVLTARQEIDLYQAVDDVMDLPRELRSYGITRVLETLNESTTVQAQENGLSIRLSQWKQGADFGWVFDNDEDSFDISHIDNFGIDGTEFLDDEDTRSPIAFYLLYRVTSLLDGRRLVLILDEFWKWLANDAFADFVYNKLKTIRKLNGIVIFANAILR
ncbi:type IV secretion system protein virB4 [Trichonephila clavipes]|nr:type IV secretion system protein virB4 [Trichonephila clavipes]